MFYEKKRVTMGTETYYDYPSSRPRTPSRISNCGEMVAEEVLLQMEEELRREAVMHMRLKTPGRRKLLVAMKLVPTFCREMLAWTIAKIAQPGDLIIALHVFSHQGTPKEQESYLTYIANAMHGFLSIYEEICNKKQITLQVEIVYGVELRKVLVEVARSHEVTKLILGTRKHFSVRRTTALARYCLKRVPCTCTIVILEHGEIIFNRWGKFGGDMTRSGMQKVLWSLKSLGRSRKVVHGGSDEPDDEERTSIFLQVTFAEIAHDAHSNRYLDRATGKDQSFSSDFSFMYDDSSIDILPSERYNGTSGFEALQTSFSSKRLHGVCKESNSPKLSDIQIERRDMFLLEDEIDNEPEALVEIESFEMSLAERVDSTEVQDIESPKESEESLIPGWPLLHHAIRLEKTTPIAQIVDRDLSVVNWALQLPNRRLEVSSSPKKLTKDQFDEILGKIAPGAIKTREDTIVGGTTNECHQTRVQFSSDSPKTKTQGKHTAKKEGMNLEQKLNSLCLDRLCTAFAYEELEAATSCFSPRNVVGQGGGSEVYRGEMRNGKLVAVKRLNCGPQAEEELLNDVEINTSLYHMHIVPLLGFCVDSPHLILVYEYLPQGNLEECLHQKDAPVLPWDVRHKVAIGIAKALDYLHNGCSRPVVHRDVKASNILLTANFDSQLADFGLAKWDLKNASIRCNNIVGTFGYLAPEYFMYGRVNDKTDVYSFGVVLLELITGRLPIDTTRPKGQENLVIWSHAGVWERPMKGRDTYTQHSGMARPLLEEWDLDKLVDPRLEGVYDVYQIKIMILAASLCVQQAAQSRKCISQILQLLCFEQGNFQSIQLRHKKTMSTFIEDHDNQSVKPCKGETGTHLDLANFLRVDDDATSQCSVDQSSVDIPHSSSYLEEYLMGRFSRSRSFED